MGHGAHHTTAPCPVPLLTVNPSIVGRQLLRLKCDANSADGLPRGERQLPLALHGTGAVKPRITTLGCGSRSLATLLHWSYYRLVLVSSRPALVVPPRYVAFHRFNHATFICLVPETKNVYPN